MAVRSWSPHDRIAALEWRVLVAAWRLGVAALLPGVDRIWIAGSRATLGPCIHLGTPDRRQKAVLFHGPDPVTVEKVAIHDDAHAAVAREAATLEAVAQLRPGLAPELLGSTGGSMRTAWIDGSLPPARLDEPVLDLLASLRLGHATPTGADGLPEHLPAYIEHGDFAPWNLRLDRGRLRLLDWEDARIPGLPLQDLIGWHLAVGHVAGRRPVAEVLNRHRPVLDAFARRIGLDAATVPPLVRLHLHRRRELARNRDDAGLAAAIDAALTASERWW
ncbi:MAG TPA: phosphotransferase [Geminicoccaceae bacterium]|nr:phosphotransferase [Geminicoccus sp.]HMU49073.1 phosphotransferase [Geminicoccaceae bacterium]